MRRRRDEILLLVFDLDAVCWLKGYGVVWYATISVLVDKKYCCLHLSVDIMSIFIAKSPSLLRTHLSAFALNSVPQVRHSKHLTLISTARYLASHAARHQRHCRRTILASE